MTKLCNSSAMPFIISQNIYCYQKIYSLAGKLFMSGIRPIETIVQYVLSEQAPTCILHNCFCMAELLPNYNKIIEKIKKVIDISFKK